MRYRLDLTLRQAEGALTRVISAAERRGYQPLQLDGETQGDGDRWHLRLMVEGERGEDQLREQLHKLHDCLDVQVSPCP